MEIRKLSYKIMLTNFKIILYEKCFIYMHINGNDTIL